MNSMWRPANICARCGLRQRQQWRAFAISGIQSSEPSNLPRVAQPSMWTSLVPKPFRRSPDASAQQKNTKAARSKEWNPATAFIVLGLLVGSNAINLIALRRDILNFSNKTDAKIELLREVIQRVKDGEDVDVEKLLGTGDPEKEKEWEEVMNEIENAQLMKEGLGSGGDRRPPRAKGWEGNAKEPKGLGSAIEATPGERQDARETERQTGQENGASERRPNFMM